MPTARKSFTYLMCSALITLCAKSEASPASTFTISQYNDAARDLHRESIDKPVTGWPRGASIDYAGNSTNLATLEQGTRLFTDQSYTAAEIPQWLQGRQFLQTDHRGLSLRVTEPGILTIIAPTPHNRIFKEQADRLHQYGYVHVRLPEQFTLISTGNERLQHSVYQKLVRPGEQLQVGPWAIVAGIEDAQSGDWQLGDWSSNDGELLYNGIRLPGRWPPRNVDPYSLAPPVVPYLKHRPDVVPVDIGRQLFVDDFLIESTTMDRVFHMPVKYAGNPVLKPETELEINAVRTSSLRNGEPGNAAATPKSGGIWWDPQDQYFKMWYEAGWIGTVALATSTDGVHWNRPELDVMPGTNQILPPNLVPDSGSIVPEWDGEGNITRWTFYSQPPGYNQQGWILTSPDGIHWEESARTNRTSDRSTHFFNPFRNKWVFSLRSEFPMFLRGRHTINRTRHYYECDDILQAHWTRMGSMEIEAGELALGPGGSIDEKVVWMTTDREDPSDPLTADPAQLYNFDAVAYESIMLGLFQLHHGPHNNVCSDAGLPKITELMFAYSRDGFHWSRPDRRAHIPVGDANAWDRGYVQSVSNIATVQGDHLFIYYIGFAGNESKAGVKPSVNNGMYDNGATGIAILRRDGFASMDAGAATATLTTRPVQFTGSHLFANVDAPHGSLRAEVQDLDGNPVAPFTLANSIPVSADSTLAALQWQGNPDLTTLADTPVRLHFELTNGSLYAFWISTDDSGRSDGYIAGGGPGYTGPTDTVGRAALNAPLINTLSVNTQTSDTH